MSRIKKVMALGDMFTFGKFMGMPVREAIERNAKEVLRMNNTGYFTLEDEAMLYLKDELL